MIKVAFLRHGPTDWNAERRLQGRTDRPLSPAGRTTVEAWSIPLQFLDIEWVTSPLLRARQTAEILDLPVVRNEEQLTEMDWGEWDGLTRTELDEAYGEEIGRRMRMGLDLRPHGGETPREVRNRLEEWLEEVANGGRSVGAVCHQGIIRAAVSLATDWNMIGRPPIYVDWNALHVFRVLPGDGLEILNLNISLDVKDP